MKRSIYVFSIAILSLSMILAGCSSSKTEEITASGTLSALTVSVSSEVSGRVVEANVNEGDTVRAGDILFRLDDEILQAQYEQASAAADAAQATLDVAQAQLAYAQSQYDLALQGARSQDMQARQTAWSASVPDDYQPAWYFQKSESITAAQAEVDAAKADLATEQSDLEDELKKASNQDFIAAEKRLAQAQVAYTIAQNTLDQAKLANDDDLEDAAQDNLDAAQAELDAARLDYDRMLSSSAADAVSRARARVAVAQARYDNARDALLSLQTGDDSLQVTAAETAMTQAQAAVTQAEANLSQAKAAAELVKLQLDRTEVKAPIDGVVLTRNLEVGEIVSAGGTIMSLGQLDKMELLVYLPEDQYGQVKLGQKVNIETDSFSDQVFTGSVVRIADEAEYTPRNVQTADGRKSTVYAVEISVPNADYQLKPGMTADVTFVPET